MPKETTTLSPLEEASFRRWVEDHHIRDLDHPDSHYDYRGFWKQTGGAPMPPVIQPTRTGDPEPVRWRHFPDTFKQSGHPTFSQESQYSRGPSEGGMWVGETFLGQPKMATSHLETALLKRRRGSP